MFDQYIPVVWGLDKKYVLQAFVVMRSILLHSEAKYHFFILTADCIDKEVREFTKTLQMEYDNFKVSVKKINYDYMEGAQIYNNHLSIAAYFRLFIPEVIQEYDKCIYLDCDLIVYGDLKELYEIELNGNYLAGVKDCHIIENTPHEKEHQRILGLPARDKYVNSGVLIIGVKKMRQDKMFLSFMKQIKKENRYEDQDVLNVCCYPFIKTIPLKYNLFHFYLGAGIRYLYGLPYDKQEFDFDHDVPYILHMGGEYKAWNDLDVKGADEWWEIAEVFSTSKSHQFYWQKCHRKAAKDKILDMINQAKKYKHIAIWGYSNNGKRLCDLLLEYQMANVEFFADNNELLFGQDYRGIPVAGLHSVDRQAEDILWIISCQISYKEVIEQLKHNGVSDNNIIRYEDMFRDYGYLLTRNENAYDSMVTGIAEREYIQKFPNMNDRQRYIKNIMKHPLQYGDEYAYLAKKYNFSYWFEIWHRERIGNEDNSYHGMPE